MVNTIILQKCLRATVKPTLPCPHSPGAEPADSFTSTAPRRHSFSKALLRLIQVLPRLPFWFPDPSPFHPLPMMIPVTPLKGHSVQITPALSKSTPSLAWRIRPFMVFSCLVSSAFQPHQIPWSSLNMPCTVLFLVRWGRGVYGGLV